MILHIVRHGKAKPSSDTGRDADRELAERGIAQAAFLGETLAGAEPGITQLIASPLVRTQQTAALVADRLGLAPDTDERLSTSTDVGAVLALLDELRDEPACVIVGHNPTLSDLAGLLTRGVGPTTIELRTGQCCTVELRTETGPGCAGLLGLERLER